MHIFIQRDNHTEFLIIIQIQPSLGEPIKQTENYLLHPFEIIMTPNGLIYPFNQSYCVPYLIIQPQHPIVYFISLALHLTSFIYSIPSPLIHKSSLPHLHHPWFDDDSHTTTMIVEATSQLKVTGCVRVSFSTFILCLVFSKIVDGELMNRRAKGCGVDR